jgi:DNA-directed RNA polymerase subunit RPC12/RpoP
MLPTRDVPCPYCGSKALQPCYTKRGRALNSLHARRVNNARPLNTNILDVWTDACREVFHPGWEKAINGNRPLIDLRDFD